MDKNINQIKVAIGMSGGVDSAVSAYLLKKAGYQVVGIFMRNWDSFLNNDILGNETVNEKICPQEKDYLDAKESANILNIELYRVDFIKEYWEYVFQNFIDEYEKGRTPNPDINCNKYIKFDKMLSYALEKLNCDYLATGHYAIVKNSNLFKAIDLEKDQSYFLSQLTKNQLKNVLFPLGNLTKKEVRKIAKEINLNVADKKDSTGICFIGERKFDKFLENYIPSQPGKIIDITTNKEIGNHNGVMYYTIGQRKGLNLGGLKEPYFLVSKDINNKILFAAPASHEEYLMSNKLVASDLNLIESNFNSNNLTAKFRYRQEDINVKINILPSNKIEVFYKKQLAITPGQHVVIYEENKCIGGAIIEKVFLDEKQLKILI
ncbi:MAG: tRNA 2-thiouridine(34) synthase MnmA [Metamycoplasmataceae bacterium]